MPIAAIVLMIIHLPKYTKGARKNGSPYISLLMKLPFHCCHCPGVTHSFFKDQPVHARHEHHGGVVRRLHEGTGEAAGSESGVPFACDVHLVPRTRMMGRRQQGDAILKKIDAGERVIAAGGMTLK